MQLRANVFGFTVGSSGLFCHYLNVTAAVPNLAVTSGSSVHTKSAVSRLVFYVQSYKA
jgi:hypothetical protein